MTLACMHVIEACRLQFCDRFDLFASMARGIPGLHGTAAFHIESRKIDGTRRGHHPALGRATDPRCDIVTQLRQWASVRGLTVDASCTKRSYIASRCLFCPQFFSRFDNGPGQLPVATHTELSVKMAGAAVKRYVTQVGVPVDCFSGVSCCKGCITTAILANAPEEIIYIQSGH